MADLYLIFNHRITRLQEEDAKISLRVGRIVDLPEGLKATWNQIPPDLEGIASWLEPIRTWLASSAKRGDYVLIQGDFGACHLMVGFATEMGLIPVYSTTRREALEEHGDDGSVKMTHRFEHQRFRRYGK
jgi:hypothetical protein